MAKKPGRGGKNGKGEGTTIVIRRVEEVAAGHHGGAWKVAYADFVTAMMAFFLLMWLLNATTEQQRRGIAAYFSPLANVENGFSGAGLVPGGVSPLDKGTSLVNKGTGTPPAPVPPQQAPASNAGQAVAGQADGDGTAADADDDDASGSSAASGKDAAAPNAAAPASATQASATQAVAAQAAAAQAAAVARKGASEQARLANAAEQMRHLVAADPALADVAGQMAIDVTPEGLRIQIMDREHQPMFDRGAATLNARAAALLGRVAPFLATLPEPLSISGYTDGASWAPGTATNWTLSSGRANAARDLLVGAGLPDSRITDVTGYADRHLLLPADPLSSANRRVVLTLRRQYPAAATQSPAAAVPPPPPAAPMPAAPRGG